MLGAGLLIMLESTDHTDTIRVIEECRGIWEVVHKNEGQQPKKDCNCSFNDENPSPSCNVIFPIEIVDRCSEKATKRPRESGSREEDRLQRISRYAQKFHFNLQLEPQTHYVCTSKTGSSSHRDRDQLLQHRETNVQPSGWTSS